MSRSWKIVCVQTFFFQLKTYILHSKFAYRCIRIWTKSCHINNKSLLDCVRSYPVMRVLWTIVVNASFHSARNAGLGLMKAFQEKNSHSSPSTDFSNSLKFNVSKVILNHTYTHFCGINQHNYTTIKPTMSIYILNYQALCFILQVCICILIAYCHIMLYKW